MTKPLIINFTPTGMIPMKDMTPHVPISVEEITEQVHEAYELGITITHLHARNPDGRPSSCSQIYGRIVESVRKVAPDLIICISLSGRDVSDIDKRAEPLLLTGDAKPDMGSLTLSSLNFIQQSGMEMMIVPRSSSFRSVAVSPLSISTATPNLPNVTVQSANLSSASCKSGEM